MTFFLRYALKVGIGFALLAGCGGSQLPISAPGAIQQRPAIGTRTDRGVSWMLPEAKSEDLLYISEFVRTTCQGVCIYSFPKLKMVGSLAAGGFGACSDSQQNIWLLSFAPPGSGYLALKYAHGGTTPIETLPIGGDTPGWCAVDRATGNLAITQWYGDEILIFQNAQGAATTYMTPPSLTNAWYCGYDVKGNLFIDGTDSSSQFALAELPVGSSQMRSIKIGQTISGPGEVQPDGSHIAITDSRTPRIYRIRVIGNRAHVLGTTRLGLAAWSAGQSVIAGSRIFIPYSGRKGGVPHNFGVWNYPSGGSHESSTNQHLHVQGAAISIAPSPARGKGIR